MIMVKCQGISFATFLLIYIYYKTYFSTNLIKSISECYDFPDAGKEKTLSKNMKSGKPNGFIEKI